MNREEAFDQAIKLIADLPCQREVIDFWDMPAVRLLPEAMSRSGCNAMRKTKEGSGLSAHRKDEGRTTTTKGRGVRRGP